MENKSIWQTLLEMGLKAFQQNKEQIINTVETQAATQLEAPVKPVEVHVEEAAPAPAAPDAIDWTNPACKVTEHFTVHDMIYLPTWKRMANEADGMDDTIKADLVKLANAMEIVRAYFGAAINPHVTYRPKEYNIAIHGALHSAHSEGLAMDFDVKGMTCGDAIRKMNADGMLEKWGMRAEDNGENPTWIHLDLRPVPPGGHRYFKP